MTTNEESVSLEESYERTVGIIDSYLHDGYAVDKVTISKDIRDHWLEQEYGAERQYVGMPDYNFVTETNEEQMRRVIIEVIGQEKRRMILNV